MHVHKSSYECMHHSTNMEVRGLVGVKSTPFNYVGPRDQDRCQA